MAIDKILQIGDPSLEEKSEVVVDVFRTEIKEVINELKRVFGELKTTIGAIGISAPQIGYNFRIFLTELPVSPRRSIEEADELRIYINPEIINQSDEAVLIYEGCLSIGRGNLVAPVMRSKTILVKAYDEFGKSFTLKCDGILARVILHEYDHLEGKLFLSRIKDVNTLMDLEYYRNNIHNRSNLKDARKITVKEVFIEQVI